jgi:ABC-2 type transport system ATP-binding protein
MQSIVQVENLQKVYGNKTALKDLSFSVKKGICFGLLGPNGAGKSTTMKILTGIVRQDQGTVQMFGRHVKDHVREIQRMVGYVPQEITLYEELSAVDNLQFFGELYSMKGKQLNQRIKEVLSLTGLLERSKDKVKGFSGGMKRRINIAAALLHRPQLLILDEPTVGIDPQSRNHIFELIRQLRDEGTTVIYSTHYMEEVEGLCDELAIIDHGQVIAQGRLQDLLQQYTTPTIYVEFEQPVTLPNWDEATRIQPYKDGFMLYTKQMNDLLLKVLQETKRKDWTLLHLETVRPSLEDVFLELTGKTLRD